MIARNERADTIWATLTATGGGPPGRGAVAHSVEWAAPRAVARP